MPKALVAFSGGLDTSFCVPYLKEKGYDVVTVTVNTGGFTAEQLQTIAAQSKKLGAVTHYEKNAECALYDQFAAPFIKANYLKGGVYPACVGSERQVIAEVLAEVAKQEKPEVVVHGSTGAGNDQVRFDVALRALIPGITILAPIRDENILREQEMAALEAWGFPMPPKTEKYSINVGLLGTTIGGGEMNTSEGSLPDDAFPMVVSWDKAKAEPETFTIQFKSGLPVGLNGKSMTGVEVIKTLNALGASHGFGKDVHLGTTIIGIKGRVGFEAPALKILIKAHTELEKLVLTSKQIFWKNTLGTVYGDLVHDGLSVEPLIQDIQALLDSANQWVNGEVTAQLFKGNLTILGVSSPNSLMNTKWGKYAEEMGGWSGQEAKGFCRLYGQESLNAVLTHTSS